jgi:hypothetical protein
MYLILALAAAAVAVVLFYDHSTSRGGELAAGWVGKAQQLAAVVLVLTQAVEGLIHALDRATGPRAHSRPPYGGARLVDVFDEEDWR